MSEPLIEVEVEADAWLAALPDAVARTVAAAKAALFQVDTIGEVTILLADDAALQELNGQFREQDKPTNVLSFPAMPEIAPHLGDVALAYETCAREAAEQGKSLGDHLAHLVAHGVLHLLGWDHQTDAEASEMEDLERTVLATLGVSDPYADHDETDAERRRPL
jgi:probable rRNA maturation factor